VRGSTKLVDRRSECGMLDRLVEAVRAGESRALVLSGEPGVGKTALLQYLIGRAPECRVVQTAGVESEMELAFAGLHQLCAPLLDGLDCLPERQGDALRIVFGMSSGPAPDRFLVGLATLGLLAHIAEQRPLVCVVDDEQWLDRASAQVLGFVARRLAAESVGLVFAARVPSSDLAGLSQLPVQGLGTADSRALLDAELAVPLDGWVRDQLVAETRGNPLALLEWPRALTTQQWTGGFGLPGALRLAGGVEESFRRRLEVLPEPTRRLLLIAAADPLGDAGLVWRAAARLGIDAEAATPAVEDGLVEFGTRVLFRHPVVRSVVYTSASVRDRRQVHGALAQVTDARLDPDRHAWHGAHAAAGPDEEVAAELEGSAGRARARGGLAAAAAFLQRATELTLHPEKRAERALAAASAQVQAGAFDAARDLLSIAKALAPNDFQQARIDLIEAELAFATARGGDTPQLLLKAAQRLESVDAGLARSTYLQAVTAAIFTDEVTHGEVGQLVQAAAATPPAANNEIIYAALEMGGTITGEHGVGTEKRQFMTKRFTPVEIAAQRAIKRVFDPTGLLNPGIMLPDESPDEPHVSSFEAAVRTALQGHPTPAATTSGSTQIAVNTANLSLVVGAAVTLDELSRHLTDHGVSCAAIPAATTQRTVGELIANPSPAERQAVRHALLGLEVVVPDGQAPARFGGENMKDVAGYDTKRLFIGGRGAFGAITTAIFKTTVNG
jgi:FAD/FMN-containing dehydrogenase